MYAVQGHKHVVRMTRKLVGPDPRRALVVWFYKFGYDIHAVRFYSILAKEE